MFYTSRTNRKCIFLTHTLLLSFFLYRFCRLYSSRLKDCLQQHSGVYVFFSSFLRCVCRDHFTLSSIPLTISSAYVNVMYVLTMGKSLHTCSCLPAHNIDSLERNGFLSSYVCDFCFNLLFKSSSRV